MIQLPLSNRPGLFALIDDEDAALLASRWRLAPDGYVNRTRDTGKGHETLGRVIMKPTPPLVVDHINGDKLDNRRANLRVVTRSRNMQNQKPRRGNGSGFRGVRYFKPRGLWRATIVANGKQEWDGYFKTPLEAAVARIAECKRLGLPTEAEEEHYRKMGFRLIDPDEGGENPKEPPAH